MKETDEELRWQNQLISYVSKRTQFLMTQSDKKKISMADSYQIISNVLDGSASLGALPEEEWTSGKKPIELIRAYNPETLTWERIDFLLMGILNETFGIYKEQDITVLAQNIFHRIRTNPYRRVPTVYHGSRYILFRNGIFDAKTRQLIPITYETQAFPVEDGNPESEMIKLLLPQSQTLDIATSASEVTSEQERPTPLPLVGFTDKHKHNFDLDLTLENPEYAGYGDSDTWTPEGWLSRTANCDPAQTEYLAQLLGVMLVPNHSFNAFIEINGESSGGKTTLINIVSAIYGGNPGVSTGYVLDDLRDRFPFRGTINRDTVMAHITEINGARLNESNIALINSFANQEMQMRQMSDVSVNLTPPPLLVMEGKGWVLFDSTKTGVARRLLPLDITKAQTAQYRNKRYGKLIFENTKVLQYFAKRAVLAYADLINGSDNFMFNLDDMTTMPAFVQTWHAQAVVAGDDQMETFSERMQMILTEGFISENLLYDLYQESVRFDDPETTFIRHRRSFKDAFFNRPLDGLVFEQVVDPMRVTNADDLAIDFKQLSETMPTPDSLKSYGKSADSKYKNKKWYKVTTA